MRAELGKGMFCAIGKWGVFEGRHLRGVLIWVSGRAYIPNSTGFTFSLNVDMA